MSTNFISGEISLGTDSTDYALILGCQRGDARAFDLLIKRHQRTVYAILHKLAPDWAGRHDDMAQDAMIRIYRGITQLRDPHAFRSWINQLVTNLFYDELRKKRLLMDVSMDSVFISDDGNESTGLDIPDLKSQPDDVLHRKEIWNEVNEAINQLPPKFKDVIVLRELHGLAYDEIARVTSLEIGTVKSRLCRARARMQTIIGQERCA